jgi:hypothetical protein
MGEKILTQLETVTRWLQLRYMAKRRTSEVIEPGRILFHPHNCRNRILKEYNQRLENLKVK